MRCRAAWDDELIQRGSTDKIEGHVAEPAPKRSDAYMDAAIEIVANIDRHREIYQSTGEPVPEFQIIADGIRRFVEQHSH